jgi:hypothetical protein
MKTPGADAASTGMMWATGAGMASTAATTIATNAAQSAHGWDVLRVKEVDMASQIPGKISVPPINRPG